MAPAEFRWALRGEEFEDPRFPWHLAALKLPDVWRLATGAGIRVAVLDNGIAPVKGLPGARLEHYAPDGTLLNDPPLPGDHGTYCASLIASSHRSCPGMAPDATVLSFHIAGPDGQPDLDAVEEALEVGCVAASAHVVSCSFLLGRVTSRLQRAVQLLSQSGVFVVGAAGNSEDTMAAFPEQVQGISAVTALDRDGELLPDVRLGEWVDAAAPGEALRVPRLSGGWASWSGKTSGAAALTADAAALALGLCDSQEELVRLGRALGGLIRSTSVPLAPELPFGRLAPLPLVKSAQALLGSLS
ncbi:S8 family peptidase [Pyxidicoccus sp. 3LG]